MPGIRENLMAVVVMVASMMQLLLLSGRVLRRESCHGIRHVFARAAALAVPGAAAAARKVRLVRVEGRGRHLEKGWRKGYPISRLSTVEVQHQT